MVRLLKYFHFKLVFFVVSSRFWSTEPTHRNKHIPFTSTEGVKDWKNAECICVKSAIEPNVLKQKARGAFLFLEGISSFIQKGFFSSEHGWKLEVRGLKVVVVFTSHELRYDNTFLLL